MRKVHQLQSTCVDHAGHDFKPLIARCAALIGSVKARSRACKILCVCGDTSVAAAHVHLTESALIAIHLPEIEAHYTTMLPRGNRQKPSAVHIHVIVGQDGDLIAGIQANLIC